MEVNLSNYKSKFLALVRVNKNSCWLWLGTRRPLPFDYGNFTIKGETMPTHRASWILHKGPIPKRICVCHKCDVPACVNPDHLFLGTYQDNMQDMIKKGRRPSFQTYKYRSPRKGGIVRGEKSKASVLTEKIVLKARKMHKGGKSYASIARELGVAPSTITSAINKESWTHI